MSDFFRAYRKLNIFLLITCICPFLQCKRSARFVCHRKYLLYVCIITIIYFAFVVRLCVYRFPPLFASLTSMVNVLKLCRSIGNAYIWLFVTSLLTVGRQSHANFFNKLYHFDETYKQNINPPIKYTIINRMYWIEITISAVYLTIVFMVEVKFNEKLLDVGNMLYWSIEVGEQIGCFFVVFHLKNCVYNLITRFRRVNYLLKTLYRSAAVTPTKMPINNTNNFRFVARNDTICQRFERITNMYDILFMARDHLQKAFSSVLLLIFVYNMFAVALSTYIVINTTAYEGNQRSRRHFLYITIKYLGFELPLTIKDFYFTTYFHFLGNQVRSETLFFYFDWILFYILLLLNVGVSIS